MSASPPSDMIEPPDAIAHDLERSLRAGVRGLLLVTAEEGRTLELLERIGERLGWPVHAWSRTGGLDRGGEHPDLLGLLLELRTRRDDALFAILDGMAELTDPATRRALREAVQRESGPAVVLVDPSSDLAGRPVVELLPELIAVAVPRPDLGALQRRVSLLGQILEESGYAGAIAALESAGALLSAAGHGLTEQAFDRLLAEAVLDCGLETPALVAFVRRHKAAGVDARGLLESSEAEPIEAVGGLEGFKRWLERRALALRPAARAVGIDPPRGVLLLGVQGCGKSLAARACASVLDLPLVRLEPGRLFGGTVGASEANLRTAIEAAERIAPVVLWIDELDKALAGAEGSMGDAGTASRVLGGLLTWLQERTATVFVVATANRVELLPPELLRRGRLDEIFFVDLPEAPQRERIVQIHLEEAPLRRLGQRPAHADPWPAFAVVARRAEGYSGAELASALTEARLDAFAEGRPLAAADFDRAVRSTVPLSITRAEELTALRQWARGRTRPA